MANPELIKVPVAVQVEQVQFERQANVDEDQTQSSIYKKAVLEKWPTDEALHEVQRAKLAELIRTVVDVESPVHEADITRRVMDSFGVSRAGNRIVDAVRSALQYGATAGIFKFENGFAYAMTSADVPVRNRSDFENSEKKIEHVAPIEIEAALIYCVTHAFTISRSDAISEALNQLGFSRSTVAISGHMNSIVDVLLKRETLKIVDEKLMISSQ
jgi:hypothetical protein